MPDVLTHLMVGVSIALLVRRDDDRIEQMMIILGAVLIDIERPFSWILDATDLYWIELGPAFHSLVGAVMLSYFAAACFGTEQPAFNKRFILILIGCISHLLLDMIMYPWVEMGIFLLYPLKVAFSFHLFWPDFFLFPIIGFACIILALIIRYYQHSFLAEVNAKA